MVPEDRRGEPLVSPLVDAMSAIARLKVWSLIDRAGECSRKGRRAPRPLGLRVRSRSISNGKPVASPVYDEAMYEKEPSQRPERIMKEVKTII